MEGCPWDSVIQVVLCIIIVPGLMIKEPPQFKTSLRACFSRTVSSSATIFILRYIKMSSNYASYIHRIVDCLPKHNMGYCI